jgi:tRNA A37 threonylcarbamoyladenosine synthetase subunit TsaC/SUA5/YrdC
LKAKNAGLKKLSAGTGFLGIRHPKNKIALDLAKTLGRPITTTSANPPSGQGGDDSYSVGDIVKQFTNKKYKPDVVINAGKLPKRKPSTVVKIAHNQAKILRIGPISEKRILKFESIHDL